MSRGQGGPSEPSARLTATPRSRRLVPVILVSGVCGALWMTFAGVDGVPPAPELTVAVLVAFTAVFIGYAAHTSLRGVAPAEQARVVAALALAALGLFFGDPVGHRFGPTVAVVCGLAILAVAAAWAAHELHVDE